MGSVAVVKNRTSNRSWNILNATNLKLLAVVLMFLDHVHQMFAAAGAPMWLTMAGRLVFPIFLFTSAESFYYTRSKKKYLQRLLLASWCMTAFTFLLQRLVPNEHVVLMNNAFSTFFVAALYMQFWDWFVEGVRKKQAKQIVKSILCCLIPIICAAPILLVGQLSLNEQIPTAAIRFLATLALLIPNVLTVEGGFLLVVLGVLFYITRKYRWMQILVLVLFSAVVYIVSGGIQWMMGFAAVPILLYNGERGRGMKHFFYVFYPAHIGILYILSSLLLS